MARELAKYQAENGCEVVITDVDVKRVLCDNQNVTDAEMKMFVSLCKAQRLNPFIKEAHLIKYGNKPATIVTGKDVFTKRAARNPKFRGFEAGVTVINKDGQIERRAGSMVGSSTERLIGGWCSVHLDGYEVPMFDEVSFEEYAGRKSDGSLNSQWKSKPGTMIRKVAIVHALREAFPEDLQGLYDASEMNVEVRESVAELVEDARPWEELGVYEEYESPLEEYEKECGVMEVEAI